MSQKNEIPILVLSILITVGLIASGFWWFSRKSGLELNQINSGNTNTPQVAPGTGCSYRIIQLRREYILGTDSAGS